MDMFFFFTAEQGTIIENEFDIPDRETSMKKQNPGLTVVVYECPQGAIVLLPKFLVSYIPSCLQALFLAHIFTRLFAVALKEHLKSVLKSRSKKSLRNSVPCVLCVSSLFPVM